MGSKVFAGAAMLAAVLAAFALGGGTGEATAQATTDPHPGQLTIIKDGKAGDLCPLEMTSVTADVSGFGARVTVVQTFTNPSSEPIEAVYTFPLPADAAVDRMRMQVGNRIIEGEINRREEARRIYDAARAAGQTAALLDQERPNIFTQSVANIMPRERVRVEISYVQVLKFEEGEFEFMFPMVVGPRFTANAPDPEAIAPPITPEFTRTGTNIELTVNIDAGAPIQALHSVQHQIQTRRGGENTATVTLAKRDEIPNRDFILRYTPATDTIQSAFLTHMDPDGKGGFFTLILMPPQAPASDQIAPREIIFVMDQSGSQRGFPIEKSRELTLKLIDTLRPGDTFNVLGFSNSVNKLWSGSRANTPGNVDEAKRFVQSLEANGGTQLRPAVVAALEGQNDPERLRLVVFNTDGFVGDEKEILDYTQKHRETARMFTFGIGNSVNRFLIDALSSEGKGDSEIVTLGSSADAAVERFVRRTQSPILIDIDVQLGGVAVSDVSPSAVPDVFSEKPIVVSGRFQTPGEGQVTITGLLGGKPYSHTFDVTFGNRADAPALMPLWARRKVEDLTRENWLVSHTEQTPGTLEAQITDLALEFGIMTEFTSFVAVEPRVVNVGGRQRTVRVPVEMADGVSYEGVGLHHDRRRGMVFGGVGGGGFGGAGAAGPPASLGATRMTFGYEAKLQDAEYRESQMSPEEARKARYERKVAKELREGDGRVEVMVWLAKVDDELLAKLKEAGLKVEEKDEKLMIVFGLCDASALIELAQLPEVERIEPLEG